jgi:UDP-GlcNAc:undecaprenyl-phosphate GlcNAc-1-phosphate transferase
MPLLGGLGIALPFISVCLLGVAGPTGMLARLEKQKTDLIILAIGSSAILGLGLLDDIRGRLRVRYKLLAQLLVALFVCFSGRAIDTITLPALGRIELGLVLGAALTIFWIVGLTNAFNMIDGVDGLAAGVALISSIALAIISAINGATFVVLLCVALAGSLLAFLLFNFHPARIFLGDTGSMFLGFTLATIALLGSYKATGTIFILVPILAFGFPIFETLVSMLRRLIRGLPIFSPDSMHTHHRLLKRGFTQRQVVVMLYAASFLLLVAAVLSTLIMGKSWRM